MSFYEIRAEEKNYFHFQHREILTTLTHFHSSVELLFVESGEIESTIDGEKQILRAGEASFADGFSVHSYTPIQKTFGFVLVGAKEDFQACFSAFGEKVPPKFFHFENFRLLSTLCELCAKNRKNPIGRYESFAGSIKIITGEIAENTEFIHRKTDKQYSLVCEILRYASEHLNGELSLLTLAKRFGYSHEYLSRFLHRYLSESWCAYVNRLRVRKADDLLKASPHLSVLEIAYACGFDSPNTFYRAYKKEFGAPPRRNL